MSLHLSDPVKTTPQLVRLPASMLPTIREYAAAKAAKAQAEKDARNADNVMKGLKGSILVAMGDSVTAVCEHVVLTVKETKDAAATVTMKDGSTTAWSLITGLLIGNRHVPAEDVRTIYGGRSGSTSLDVTGA